MERLPNKENLSLTLPKVILEKIVNETRDHMGHETGGLVLGLRLNQGSHQRLIPLTVFTPYDNEILRSESRVKIGGLTCKRYQLWALAAWENLVANSSLNSNWGELLNGEFGFLGMWHSHPSGIPEYSTVDGPMVNNLLKESPFDDFLFIIASADNLVKPQPENYTYSDHRGNVNINFYYRHKENINKTHALKPRVTTSPTPILPGDPWFVKNPNLYKTLTDELSVKLGYRISPLIIPSTETITPPLMWLKCFDSKKDPEGKNPFYIGTDHDFDQTGICYFTMTSPDDGKYLSSRKQKFNMKEWGVNSLVDLVGVFSFFSKIT